MPEGVASCWTWPITAPSTGGSSATDNKTNGNRPKASLPPETKGSRAAAGLFGLSRRQWALIGAVAAIVASIAFIASARATDAPAFCGTCHEMKPYVDAWTVGRHHGHAECVDCHVDAGLSRYTHKFAALGEVWSHFTGYAGFPMPVAPLVPDSRCIRCHPTVTPKGFPASFSHALHAKQGPCQMCHATTGHDVPVEALRAAGVYNAAGAAARPQAGKVTGVPGTGKADVAGHPAVACSNCHDMAALPCSACHTPPHQPRGDCKQCHQPGRSFTFAHPRTQMPNWQNIACVKCHPTSYTQVNCTCHPGGTPKGD